MMRLVRWIMLGLVLVTMANTAQARPNSRACPGRSVIGTACCISGTVTLGDKLISDAEVQVQLAKGGKVVFAKTSVAGDDVAPTYGFALHDAPLSAQPGDVLVITATYEGWTQTVQHTVVEGEQWRDIALDGPKTRTPKPRMP